MTSQKPTTPPVLPFERVEAASLAIDALLDSIFGACPKHGQELQAPTTYSNLSQYRAHTSSLSHLIRLTSLKIFSLETSLLQARDLLEELESRQKRALSIRNNPGFGKPRNVKFGLPTEIVEMIFAYAFPREDSGTCKYHLSESPWREVVLRTTTIDVRCGDVVLLEKINESEVKRIASTAPAALSLSLRYDSDYLYQKNAGELLIKALTPHLGRCRTLDLPMTNHECCVAVQKAVKEGLLRVGRLKMKLNHGPCIVECIAPALLHLSIKDETRCRDSEDLIGDIILVLRATLNLRTFSYTNPCISFNALPSESLQPTDTIILPHLQRMSFRASLASMITLVQRLTDMLETPAVLELCAGFVKSGNQASSLPERFIELIDAKFPQLERLEMTEIEPETFQTRFLQILNDSTQGPHPYLPNLSGIAIAVSDSLFEDSPGLLELLARNRARSQLTANLSFLEFHQGVFADGLDPLFRERIQLFYPNFMFL